MLTRPNGERRKPCGLEGHCPLVDEHRFFAEASETFWRARLPENQVSRLVNLAMVKWCKAPRAREIRPRLPECRRAMEEAARAWRDARAQRLEAFIDVLTREARARRPAPLTAAEVERALEVAKL